jgi:hypothetical protein
MQSKIEANYTKNELKYINDQIECEISVEEFKATMGLKNESRKEINKYYQ